MMSLGLNLTDSLRPLYVKSLGATVIEISLVVSIAGMAGTLMRVPSGILSDSRGRRKIILASIFMSVLPPLMYTMSSSWQHLIPWGILYSAAFALYMPSKMAIIADFTTPQNRTRIYSIMGIAFPLGGTVGPTVAGLIQGAGGWNNAFYVASILFIICLIPSWLLPKPTERGDENEKESRIEGSSGLDSLFLSRISVFVLLHLLIGLAIGTTNNLTPIYLSEKFGMSTTEVGLFTSIGSGLMMILCQIPGGILAERFGRKKLISICFVLEPFLFVSWIFVNNLYLLLLVQMGINALWSMTWPATMSLVMEYTPGPKRGVASGFIQMGMMLGFTLGPILGGYLWETLGMVFPYLASAIFFALCLAVTPTIARKQRELSQNTLSN
jgi:DHA1 family multidrug resistance protein-like MFS transporter